MEIRKSGAAEIARWMALTKAVREFFPGLESPAGLRAHEEAVLRYMAAGRALGAWDEAGLAGMLLYTAEPPSLDFLAVRPDARRRGAAEALVRAMDRALGGAETVTLMTHPAGVPGGEAARAFYRKMGFEEGPLTEAFGAPVQVFVRRRRDPR